MTRYYLFEKLAALTQMEKTGEFQWNKMIATGNLGLHDYGTGFIDLCIYYLYQQNNHICRLWFGTIDDGDFGAWIICKNEKKAKAKVKRAVNFFTDMSSFPTINKLNKDLSILGIYVSSE